MVLRDNLGMCVVRRKYGHGWGGVNRFLDLFRDLVG